MSAKLLALGRAVGGLLTGAAALILFLFPLTLWPLGAALSGAMVRTPHLLAALVSLPPLLCMVPLLALLPACWRGAGRKRRALLLALAVPATACWLLAFVGSVVMAPFQLGWRVLPYLALAVGFYACAIPLSQLVCSICGGTREGDSLSTLGAAVKAALVLVLLISVLSYPTVGLRDWVWETERGPVVHVWLALDGGSSGSISAPGYEPVGPLLYGARLDLAWDAPDYGQGG